MGKLRALTATLGAFGVAAALAMSPATAQAAGSDTTFTSIPPVNDGSTLLYGVSLKSATDAWGVGVRYLNQNTVIATEAQRWNGTSWQVTPTVNPTGNVDVLNGVVNISPSSAWAVGYSQATGGGYSALTEHWNGSRWVLVRGGSSSTSSQETLNAVGAVSDHDVWAVGEHFDSTAGGDVGLIEHFDGTNWNIVPAPTTYTAAGIEHSIPSFSSVVALSPTNVWAASNSGVQTAVVEHWDGTAWSVVPTPTLTTVNGQSVNTVAINGLSATSGSDVWAVGGTVGFGRHAPHNQLIEHWNGSSWSVVPSPADATTPYVLTSVASLSATDAWALGLQPGTSNPGFEHWNGTSWSNISVPAASGNIHQLSSAPVGTLIGLGGVNAVLSKNA